MCRIHFSVCRDVLWHQLIPNICFIHHSVNGTAPFKWMNRSIQEELSLFKNYAFSCRVITTIHHSRRRVHVCFHHLTFCAQAGARSETGHVDNLYGKLLACVPVDASPHHAEGTPETHTHTHVELVEDFEASNTRIALGSAGTFLKNPSPNRTHQPCADSEPFLKKIHDSLCARANGNYRAVVCSTAVKAKIKALL